MTAQVESPAPSRRSPTIAAILGFIWPGVGYMYAGDGRRGLLLLLLLPVAELGILLLAVLVPLRLVCVALPMALMLLLHFLFALGAAHAAHEFRPDRPLPFFSRWYSCLAALILTSYLGVPLVQGYRTTFVQAFEFPTGSMEPTVLIGDHIFAVKWAYGWREPVFGRLISDSRQPRRGDLVVFRFPEDRSRWFLKRCIGLPGDTVEVRGRAVLIDGKPLDEPYARFMEPLPAVPGFEELDPRIHWGPKVVPADSYFVLGDNRDNSRDSRFWGFVFVPKADLLGRAVVVYWSYNATREDYRATDPVRHTLSAFVRTRWDRIGRRLE